jgi:hypothetical protein
MAKVVTAPAKRELVRFMSGRGLSKRAGVVIASLM